MNINEVSTVVCFGIVLEASSFHNFSLKKSVATVKIKVLSEEFGLKSMPPIRGRLQSHIQVISSVSFNSSK